jgi:hypothetical protein
MLAALLEPVLFSLSVRTGCEHQKDTELCSTFVNEKEKNRFEIR